MCYTRIAVVYQVNQFLPAPKLGHHHLLPLVTSIFPPSLPVWLLDPSRAVSYKQTVSSASQTVCQPNQTHALTHARLVAIDFARKVLHHVGLAVHS